MGLGARTVLRSDQSTMYPPRFVEGGSNPRYAQLSHTAFLPLFLSLLGIARLPCVVRPKGTACRGRHVKAKIIQPRMSDGTWYTLRSPYRTQCSAQSIVSYPTFRPVGRPPGQRLLQFNHVAQHRDRMIEHAPQPIPRWLTVTDF